MGEMPKKLANIYGIAISVSIAGRRFAQHISGGFGHGGVHDAVTRRSSMSTMRTAEGDYQGEG
jgi:hypothetical protein